jgi:hypothetical protein
MSRYALQPETHAAHTIGVVSASSFVGSDLDLTTLMHELQRQSEAVNGGALARGEAMLTAQAQTLDALFTC